MSDSASLGGGGDAGSGGGKGVLSGDVQLWELRRKIEFLEAQVSTYRKITIPGFCKRIEIMEGNGAALEIALAASKNSVSVFKKKFEDAAEKVAALEAAAEKMVAAQEEVDSLQQEVEALRQKSEELRVAMEKQASTFEERIAVLLADSAATSSQLRQSEEKLQEGAEEVSHYMQVAKEKVEGLQEKVDALKDLIAKETGGVWQGPMLRVSRKRPRGGQNFELMNRLLEYRADPSVEDEQVQAVSAEVEPSSGSPHASGSCISAQCIFSPLGPAPGG